MGRNKKHPTHAADAERLMNALLDELVALWTCEEEPELKSIAEEIELSPAKVRKLLITAGVRDHTTYYSSSTADMILKLWKSGKSTEEISVAVGLSKSSVVGYLPHTKIIYSLNTLSAEAERLKFYRARQKAVAELNAHQGLADEDLCLWKCICLFENYPFKTSGRGSREGVKFSYTVSRSGGAGGKHYSGEQVEGYGNEIWIEGKEKSISRSTVELGYKRAVEAGGAVKGPKALGLPGAGSYLYPILVRLGVIEPPAPGIISQRKQEYTHHISRFY